MRVMGERFEGGGKSFGVACIDGGTGVGEVLASAGDGEVDKLGEDRRDDGEDDRDDDHESATLFL